MKHLDLFSGIGGFALAIDRVWDDVEHVFCDNESFSQAVLKKHWPNSKIYGDIRTLTADTHWSRSGASTGSLDQDENKKNKGRKKLALAQSGGHIDFLTGGFPCQPFSQAGKRRGTADDRHLWPEMLRVISEFHPRWVVAENVGGLVTWDGGVVLEQIHLDLESENYEVQAFIIPAVAVNAPHRRDRVWIVAHSRQQYGSERNNEGVETNSSKRSTRSIDTKRQDKNYQYPNSINVERKWTKQNRTESDRLRYRKNGQWNQNWTEVASRLCRVDDGIPKRLDRNPRLKSLGNAIVPQVAEEIFKVIKGIL